MCVFSLQGMDYICTPLLTSVMYLDKWYYKVVSRLKRPLLKLLLYM